MPSMEELLNQISTEIRILQNKPWWISKIDLEYSYGQLNLFEERSEHCDFSSNGKKREQIIQVEKNLRSIRYLDNIPRKIHTTLNYQTPVWLDKTIKLVTRGDKESTGKKFSQHSNNFKKPDTETESVKRNTNFFPMKQLGWDTN